MSQFYVTSSSSTSGGVTTITGNTGGPVSPVAGNINIVTENSTVMFAGSGNTETLDFGEDNLLMGSDGSSITVGEHNTAVGLTALDSLTAGSENTCIGYRAGFSLTTGGPNTFIGVQAGQNTTQSVNNTAIGSTALANFTNGAGNSGANIAIGSASLTLLQTGINNICIGTGSGNSYIGSESSNILINSYGVASESNIIRIGIQGSSTGQQTDCYLAGVLHTTSGRIVNVTTPGAYPYTAVNTDYVIVVDTSIARTINLIAAPSTGSQYIIKDLSGSASINNITVSGNGSNVDGSATYVINSNYASITVIYNGTSWSIV